MFEYDQTNWLAALRGTDESDADDDDDRENADGDRGIELKASIPAEYRETPYDRLTEKMDPEPVAKEWQPYEGPQGGEGWIHTATGEVRYQESKPTDEPRADFDGPTEGDGAAAVTTEPESGSLEEFQTISPGDTIQIDVPQWDGPAQVEVQAIQENPEFEGGLVAHGELVGEDNMEIAVQPEYFDGIVSRDNVDVDDENETGGEDREWRDTAIKPEKDPSELTGSTGQPSDWVEDNLFAGQRVLVETPSGEREEGEIQRIRTTNGGGYDAEVDFPDLKWTETFSDLKEGENWHDYELVAVEDVDTVSDDRLREGIMSQFEHGTTIERTPEPTEEKFTEHVAETVIPSFKDTEVAREVFESFFLLRDEVGRASVRGTDGFSMRISEDESRETINHEFGHGVACAYGYDYRHVGHEDKYSDEKWKRRPTNVSHEWRDLRVEYGGIPFDFSDDSPWFDPEDYMFRDHDEPVLRRHKEDLSDPSVLDYGDDILIEDEDGSEHRFTVDFADEYSDGRQYVTVQDSGVTPTFHPDGTVEIPGTDVEDGDAYWIDKQVEGEPVGYSEWQDTIQEEIENYEYIGLDGYDYDEEVPNGEGVYEKFETLEEGDVVKFNVVTSTAGEIDGEEERHLIFKEKKYEYEDRAEYAFETETGGEWRWAALKDDRGLDSSNGSEVVGIERQPELTEEIDFSEEAENPDHPLARWRGFDTTAETGEEKVENLLSAVNRAWYKQAKLCEDNPDSFDASSAKIGSFYSTTNSQETLAQTHQVMQTEDDVNEFEVEQLAEEYPYLVEAYLELFNPSDLAREVLRENGWEGDDRL